MYATVQELVDALTPEEKAGLCTGAAVPRLGLPALRVSGLHSRESAGGVCFPSACAAAASFDPEAARRMGAALGREARSDGAQLLDVPDVDLKRGPLSGRSADTWAEDPCLTGALAAAFIQGVQSAGVGACAGRLAVVNQETDRRTLNRRVDERTLQELYLPAFETAVRDGQPRAVVCSAGQLNGTRVCEDTALLTDTLRGAWGFAGAVLAEPGAVQDPARTLAAGVDFAPADAGRLVDAVQSGALDCIAAGMSPTDIRKETVDFTSNYWVSNLVVITKKDGTLASASSLSDLAGKTIGAQVGTFHADALSQIANVQSKIMDDFTVLYTALNAGTIDGYVAEEPTAYSICAANNTLMYVPLVNYSTGFTCSDGDAAIAVGVRKGSNLTAEFNRVIDAMTDTERSDLMQKMVAASPIEE